MLRNALRFGLCAVCVSMLCAALCHGDADSGSVPSITEMESVARGVAGAVAEDEATEVGRAVDEAKAKLEGADPYGAKAVLMRLERFTELDASDYAVVGPVAEEVDKALGEDKARVEAEIEAELAEEEHWAEFHRIWLIQNEVDRRQSRALTDQATVELYIQSNPERAEILARQALALDPKNEEADRILTAARVEQGYEQATVKSIRKTLAVTTAVRVEYLKQELAVTKQRAARLYAEGEFVESLQEWRKAETYVNVLSVWTDVQQESLEVQKQIEAVEGAAARQLRQQKRAQAQEARDVMEMAVRRIEESEAEQEAQMLDRIWKLIREKRYDDARKLIKELKYKDPGNEAAQVVDELLTHEEHAFVMGEQVWRTEQEDLALIQKTYEQAIPYAQLMDFPDKRTWVEVISAREEVRVPSKLEKYTDEELEVIRQLNEKVTLAFDETTLPEVVEFLQVITPVNYVIQRQDLPPDLAPITLHIETSLRNALDMICDLAGLAWKVEGSVIRIANAERLKEYELRIYDIRDLLLNTADKSAGGGRGRTTRRTDRRYDDDYGGDDYYGDSDYYDGGDDYYSDRSDRGGRRDTYGGESEDLRDRADALRQIIMETVAWETWEGGGAIGGVEGDRQWEERGFEEDVWGRAPAVGFAVPTDGFGEARAAVVQPRGRAFFRAGSPGDLIIVQTSEVHAQIGDLLRELRAAMYIQVHVQTRFIEVTADFIKEVGFGIPTFDTNPEDIEGESETTISIGTGIPMFAEAAGAGLDIAFGFFDGTALEGFFRAVETHRGCRTLAMPFITLMNAQRGYITVETTQSYVSSWRTAEEAFEPEISEISETISLDVRPFVSSDRRYVYLELAPLRTGEPTLARFDWETVVPAETEGGQPAVATNYVQLPEQLTQEFEVTVAVPDRGILMVGGLSSYGREDVEKGVPVLNKIPILKRLFMGEGLKIDRRTLLILVRPQIILLPEAEEGAF